MPIPQAGQEDRALNRCFNSIFGNEICACKDIYIELLGYGDFSLHFLEASSRKSKVVCSNGQNKGTGERRPGYFGFGETPNAPYFAGSQFHYLCIHRVGLRSHHLKMCGTCFSVPSSSEF